MRTMIHSLRISRELWPEVTSRPHFIMDLDYEGCRISWDDIYFAVEDEMVDRLREMRIGRKGKVALDGGFRFLLTVEMQATGGVTLGFRTESGAEFPGKRILEGFFEVGGEYTDALLGGLVDLIDKGRPFSIAGSPGVMVDVR
ncbi:hypothetical protein [Thiolapillus sp.]|uniref:hypothetical protein n=1 Tax=Thiolapillus sp. TaxID=2017437 RepID=UPI003AF879AA